MHQSKSSLLIDLLTLALCFMLSYGGTVLEFSVTPNVIAQDLTEVVHMQCGVNDVAKRSDNHPEDIDHVSTIFITNAQGKTIAEVGPGNRLARVLISDGGLSAEGNVDEKAHLDLTFDRPSEMTPGDYTCKMVGFSTYYTPVQIFKTWTLQTRPPTIPDVIAAFKSKDEDQHQLILGLKQEIDNLKQCVSPRVGFTVTFRNTGTVSLDNNQLAKYDNILVNVGGGYDPTTGAFTCSIPGQYSFTVHVLGSETSDAGLGLQLNGEVMTSAFAEAGDYNTASTSVVLELQQGDVVNVKAEQDSWFHQPGEYNWGYQQNIFNGHLIQAAPCNQN